MKLPGRRSKTSLMTEDQKRVESKFGRCPKGHALPNRTNRGNCTPLFCAGSTPGKQRKAKPVTTHQEMEQTKSELAVQDVGDVDQVELQVTQERMAKAVTRHKARMAFAKVPEFADAKERERWVENKKEELVPLALADVEFSLKLGDAQEREKARKEVLDMTGHGKRDTGGGSTSPLIILAGITGNLADNPWVRKVIDVSPTKELPNGKADPSKE